MNSVLNLRDMIPVSLYIAEDAVERHNLKRHSLVEEIVCYTSDLMKLSLVG